MTERSLTSWTKFHRSSARRSHQRSAEFRSRSCLRRCKRSFRGSIEIRRWSKSIFMIRLIASLTPLTLRKRTKHLKIWKKTTSFSSNKSQEWENSLGIRTYWAQSITLRSLNKSIVPLNILLIPVTPFKKRIDRLKVYQISLRLLNQTKLKSSIDLRCLNKALEQGRSLLYRSIRAAI